MQNPPIVIIDYGMGNVGSIKNMIAHIGGEAVISRDPEIIRRAPKLILAGVGAFDEGMQRLEEYKLINLLEECVLRNKTPLLAICVGMQLLFERSEEGIRKGLGWIEGEVKKFPNFPQDKLFQGIPLKIPHMGWNTVERTKESRLTHDLSDDARFYFVHSYFCTCKNSDNVLLQTSHGITFASAIEQGPVFGVQFHPEKSHRYGMTIYKNFLTL